MAGLPVYKELKRRCDFCDKDFRKGDLVAVIEMAFQGGSRPYMLVFCLSTGEAEQGEMRCLRHWRFKYEIKIPMDFIVMEYHGKRRGGSGDTGRFPAYI